MKLGIKYFKEKLRFESHNSEYYKKLLKKQDLLESEFEKLFVRMEQLDCMQMQLQLIKNNQDLVNLILIKYKQDEMYMMNITTQEHLKLLTGGKFLDSR